METGQWSLNYGACVQGGIISYGISDQEKGGGYILEPEGDIPVITNQPADADFQKQKHCLCKTFNLLMYGQGFVKAGVLMKYYETFIAQTPILQWAF